MNRFLSCAVCIMSLVFVLCYLCVRMLRAVVCVVYFVRDCGYVCRVRTV